MTEQIATELASSKDEVGWTSEEKSSCAIEVHKETQIADKPTVGKSSSAIEVKKKPTASSRKKHPKPLVYPYPIPQKPMGGQTHRREQFSPVRLPRVERKDSQHVAIVLYPPGSAPAAGETDVEAEGRERIREYRDAVKALAQAIMLFEEGKRSGNARAGFRRSLTAMAPLSISTFRFPLAIRAEMIVKESECMLKQLNSIQRSTRKKERCAVGFLNEVVWVEDQRHRARQWKSDLLEAQQQKTVRLCEKTNKELLRANSDLGDKLRIRKTKQKDLRFELRNQTKEAQQRKNAQFNATKQLSAVETSYILVADPPESPSSRFGHRTAELPKICTPASQETKVVRAMKAAVSQMLRSNRDIEAMIAVDKVVRKQLLARIQKLLESLASHRQLQAEDGTAAASRKDTGGQHGYHNAWSGPKAGDVVVYRATSRAKTFPDAESGVEVLQRVAASSGRFAHMLFSDLPVRKVPNVLKFAALEFQMLANRSRALEHVFQLLHEIRFFRDVQKAVAYIVHLLCCCMECERVSYWVIDNARGIAWTKSAAGGKEIVIPSGTGIVGSSLRMKSVVHVRDAYADPRFNRDNDAATGFRTKSVLCTPILQPVDMNFQSRKRGSCIDARDGKVIAIVQAINKKPTNGVDRDFDDTDIFMLSILGASMTDVVLKCEQQELDAWKHRRKDIWLNCVLELSLSCDAAVDLVCIVKKYLGKMFQAIDISLTLAYYDHVMRLDVGDDEELVCVKVRKGVGLVGACTEMRQGIHVRDLSIDRRYNPTIDIAIDAGARHQYSLHCLPLKRGALLSAVVQWVCPQRSRVDFGDDGMYNEDNPRHIDLINLMMANVLTQLEKWYPVLSRLQKVADPLSR